MTKRQGKLRWAVQTLILVACCTAHRAIAAPVISNTGVKQYLSQFGYLPPVNPKSEGIMSEESLSSAISEFQSFAGINITGNMDSETAHMMTLPRCGVKDKVGPGTNGRSKRYALFDTKWHVNALTYKISKYPRILDSTTVDREVARALSVWSGYTDLTFTPKTGKVDIEIRFEYGNHGDGDPFDGESGVLAHAFSPGYGLGGDAHFDVSEKWTIDSYRGVNFFQVAAHEFGHSLGLDHSNIQSALMAPFYRTYEPNFKLHTDDIHAIQAIYGSKTTDQGPGTDDFYPDYGYDGEGSYDGGNNGQDICKDPRIDTIFTALGYVYVFKGEHYWRLTAEGIATGYPKSITTGWKGLPGNIDAAFTAGNGKTYFFKGSEYWVYTNGGIGRYFPRKIGNDFPGIPDNIDAATVRSRDGQVYFFKGSKFWRFNFNRRLSNKRSSPEPISSYPGLPENLDAAFSNRGSTYFFKGSAYYRFNDRTFSMDSASPFETGPEWFGCSADNNEAASRSWW